MSAEQDTAAKSGKKLSALLVLGGVIIIGGGYLLLTWLSPENSASLSSVNINSTTTGSGRTVVESQHYRDLLRADNERGAAEALRNNQTFIASLPRGLDTDHGKNQSRDTQPADQAEGSGQPSTPPQADQTAREKQREALQKLLARINTQHPDARPPVVAAAMWGATGAPGISSHASPPGTGTSPQPRLQEASLATPAARTGIQLIPALTRVPAFIDTEVDSDNAVSRVVASVPAGPWAGAVLYSQDARLAGKGMDIHFDRMMWRGMFLKVNAYALNEHTGMSSVASDVNHRWFKHIVLPSILGGAGKGGSLYKDANTQIKEIVANIKSDDLEILFRMDSGYFDEKIIETIESLGCKYLIKAKSYSTLTSQATNSSIVFVKGEEGRETTELYTKLVKWEKDRRFVVSRVLKPEKERAQLSLLEGSEYDYFFFVTNTTLLSEKVVIYYEKRGNAENYIKEAKYDMAVGHLLLKSFWANEAVFQMMMLSYNLFLLFKFDSLDSSEYRQQIKTFRLKYVFLAAKIIKTARYVIMKLSENYPYKGVYEKCLV
uniref:Sex pilus assembly/synthesis protein n=234 Tax=root TaxID=1 RepID=H9XP67_ECOLX|nr:sex pilus assembly/synthesis protein [Escherichia coli]